MKQWVKAREAKAAMARAEQLAGEEAWPEVMAQLRTAISEAPDNEDVLRRSAFLLSLGSPADAVMLWERLDQVGTMTAEDRQSWVSALISTGQLERAGEVLDGLEAEGKGDRVTGLMRLRWYAAQEDYEGAAPRAAALAREYPEDEEVALWRASIDILGANARDEEVSLESWRTFLPLAGKAEGGLGVLALDVVIGMETCPPELAEECRALLTEHASRQERHLLKWLEWSIQLEPERAPVLIAEAMEGRKKWAPADRYWMMAWLNQRGYHRDALEMVSDTEVLTHGGLFLARLDALLRMNRLEEAGSLLAMKPIPLTPALYSLSMARVAVARGADGEDMASRFLAEAGKGALLGKEWGTFAESFRLARERGHDETWKESVGTALSSSRRLTRKDLLAVEDILKDFGEDAMAVEVVELLGPGGGMAGPADEESLGSPESEGEGTSPLTVPMLPAFPRVETEGEGAAPLPVAPPIPESPNSGE
ncbi:MAG: hypothetical protein AAF591_21330 [Verrucomicrobiota bacterium]